MFEGEIGPVTVEELLAMPPDTWGHLRDIITDRWVESPSQPLARCLMCNRGVYIRVSVQGEERLPLFAHYKHENPDCQWHSAGTQRLRDARAAQYQGQQESELHRSLCLKLDELLRADPAYRRSTVEQYHEPTGDRHGRYPDVYVELEGLPPVTLELQLSKTFAPEIAARGRYYEREAVGLIWVLYGVHPGDEDVPQAFRDVIRRHRGNAFVFDQAAVTASGEAGTLILRCYLRKKDGSFYRPRLTRLADLTFPEHGLPYLEDRRTPELLEPAKAARERWWAGIATIRHGEGDQGYSTPELDAAYASLRHHVPSIRQYCREIWEHDRRRKSHVYKLLATLFSIARTAHDGRDRNLATAHSGKGAMVSMLNTRLHSEEFQPYGVVIETMLKTTAASRLLSVPSLSKHIALAKLETRQAEEGHPAWEAATWLFPEVFDPLVRNELQSLGALPEWAIPSAK